MTIDMIFFYLTVIGQTIINVLIWKGVPDWEREHIQATAPRWIPRNVLFECMICTSFWLSVPNAILFIFITGDYMYLDFPFVAACLTFLYFDLEHKFKNT